MEQMKRLMDDLAVVQREQTALDARRRKIEDGVKALTAVLFHGGSPSVPVAQLPAPAVPSASEESFSEKALRLALANPGVHYSAYVAQVYGTDTAANRVRLRSVLSYLRRDGQLASLGNGAWGPPSPTTNRRPKTAAVGESTRNGEALALLVANPDGLTASQIRGKFPDDKKKGVAIYNATFQLHARDVIDRVEGPNGMVYKVRPEAPDVIIEDETPSGMTPATASAPPHIQRLLTGGMRGTQRRPV